MSEEIENAALNVPRAILTTMILNGATGFAMVLAVLFCLGDPDSVLVSLQPIIYVENFSLVTLADVTHRFSLHPSLL